MDTSATERSAPLARHVRVHEERLTVDLQDGRTITVPIVWYPRLSYATPAERDNWTIIAGGEGIHWPDLDEDLSVDGLLNGRPSGEGPASLKRWLQQRGQDESAAD